MTLPGPAQGRRGGRPRALSGCMVSTPHARVYHIVVHHRMRGRLGCCAGAIVAERGPPKPRPLQGPNLTGISSTPHRQPPSRYLFDTTLYRTPVRPLPTPTIPVLGCRKRIMSLQSPLKRALFCPLSSVHRLLAKAGCVRWRAGGMRTRVGCVPARPQPAPHICSGGPSVCFACCRCFADRRTAESGPLVCAVRVHPHPKCGAACAGLV